MVCLGPICFYCKTNQMTVALFPQKQPFGAHKSPICVMFGLAHNNRQPATSGGQQTNKPAHAEREIPHQPAGRWWRRDSACAPKVKWPRPKLGPITRTYSPRRVLRRVMQPIFGFPIFGFWVCVPARESGQQMTDSTLSRARYLSLSLPITYVPYWFA